MIGKTISHYRITRELGAGGMGVVYEAADTKLDRPVALKFLPPESTRDPVAKARFIREAKAASALDHPNVCTIYEVDETDNGQLFLAMACYEGEILKKRIARGPLPIDDAVDITRQIAEGLAKAHERDIVHRDIKPANIFINNDGLVKILDFGLAKLAGQTMLTKTGSTMGTASYMSPEQARGEAADHRSDLWSLGTVLFEMATGQLPFPGDHEQAVIYAILNIAPESAIRFRAEIPQELECIATRCLAKNPAGRYQAAKDIVADLLCLQRNSSGTIPLNVADNANRVPVTNQQSVAVLPFEDLSPEGDQGYFCDGIAEDLINNLTHIHSLRVIARGSSFAFKGQATDVRVIGQKLDVQTLLTGSLRKAGDRLRIIVQLVDVTAGCQVWSERYDRRLTDVFAIQDDIALAVVEALKIELLGREFQAIEKVSVEDVTTYNRYLKGRYHWNERTEKGLRKAVQYFEDAVALEPDYTLAHVGLADSFNMLGAYGYAQPAEVYPRAKAAALRALEIDPATAEAHASLGWVLYEFDWDWSGAEREFCHAVNLKPGCAVTRMWNAHFLMVQGRLDEAIQEFRHALEVDPLALVAHANIGCCHYYAHRLEQAKEVLRFTLEISPGHPVASQYLAWTHLAAGDHTEAIMELLRAGCDSGEYHTAMSSLGYAHGVAGDTAAAQAVLTKLRVLSDGRFIPAFDFALVHLGLGEVDLALQWLEESFSRHESGISYLRVHPLLNPLRDESRFRVLLKGAGLD